LLSGHLTSLSGQEKQKSSQVGQILGVKTTSQIWQKKHFTLGPTLKQEGRTKTAQSKFYNVTNLNNPCYKFGKIISKLEARALKQGKWWGKVKQRIQNWNQQATKI
jgi:hypothetical protein